MKVKLVGAIILVVVAAMVVGNVVVGNNLADRLKTQLERVMQSKDHTREIEIGQLTVNPLLSKITIKNVRVFDLRTRMEYTAPLVDVHLSYQEAVRLSKAKKLEELKSFRVLIHALTVKSASTNDALTLAETEVDFKGHLTKADVEQLDERFPEKDQSVKVRFNNLHVSSPNLMSELGIAADEEALWTTLDEGVLSVDFLSESKELRFNQFNVSSALFKYESTGQWRISGTGLRDAKIMVMDTDTEFQIIPDQLEWGNPHQSGRYSIAGLNSYSKGTLALDTVQGTLKSNTDHDFSFELNDLKVNYAGRKKAEMDMKSVLLGVSVNDIVVNRFQLKTKLKQDKLVIKDTKLETSLFNASLSATIRPNLADIAASPISGAKLMLSDLNEDLEGRIATLELMMGRSLPREGNAIALQIYGSIGQPKVQGLPF